MVLKGKARWRSRDALQEVAIFDANNGFRDRSRWSRHYPCLLRWRPSSSSAGRPELIALAKRQPGQIM